MRAGQTVQRSEATQQLEGLQAELQEDLAPERRLRALMEVGYLLQDLERFREAGESFRLGSELARASGDQGMLVIHLGNLANVSFYLGDLHPCVSACDEAIAVARAIGRDDHVWRLANTSGAANLRLGDYDAATDAFTLALEVCPTDDAPARALLYVNLATAELNVGELARAHELLDLALPIFVELGSPQHLAAVHATRADVLYMEGKLDEALEHQEEALRLRQEVGLEADVAGSLVGIARIRADQGELDLALAKLQEALEIQQRLELRADTVTTLGLLADAYAQMHRNEEARDSAEESLQLAEANDLLAHRVETLYSLAEVHEAEGDPASALAVLREAVALERELNTRATRARMAEAESTIARQEALRTLAAEREERRAQVRLMLGVGAVGLLVAGFVGWALFLSKRRAMRRLDGAHRELSAANEAEIARALELEVALREIHEFEEERIRAAKLESLGLLAGGLAHDFNNVLTALLGYVSLARSKVLDRPELREELEWCESAIQQGARLARQLLALSKGGAPVRELCDLNLLVREAAAIAASGSNVLLRYRMPNDLWLAEVDPGQISQVISNLVLNAIQAMPDGGKIRISAENRREKGPEEGPFVRLRVEDTGPGISEEQRAAVFDPYFSTRVTGSGLGLTTAYAIVGRHQGKIRLEPSRGPSSGPSSGTGACFVIDLPASPDAVLPAPRPAAVVEPAPRTARILVLDDEAPIRRLYQRTLSWMGYDHVLAADGRAAVDEFVRARDEGRSFDLLILDLTLPGGMGGTEVLAELRGIDPNVRAIVSSGYSDSAALANPADAGFAGVLAKPFTVAVLARAIQDALAQPMGGPAARAGAPSS